MMLSWHSRKSQKFQSGRNLSKVFVRLSIKKNIDQNIEHRNMWACEKHFSVLFLSFKVTILMIWRYFKIQELSSHQNSFLFVSLHSPFFQYSYFHLYPVIREVNPIKSIDFILTDSHTRIRFSHFISQILHNIMYCHVLSWCSVLIYSIHNYISFFSFSILPCSDSVLLYSMLYYFIL